MAKFTREHEFNCPYCGDRNIVKNGKQSGKQRYRCKGCQRRSELASELGLTAFYVIRDEVDALAGALRERWKPAPSAA